MGAIAVMWSHALVPFSELYVTLHLCRTLGGSRTGKTNKRSLFLSEFECHLSCKCKRLEV